MWDWEWDIVISVQLMEKRRLLTICRMLVFEHMLKWGGCGVAGGLE
jgi:hypothetical protein